MTKLPSRYRTCEPPLLGGFGEVLICEDTQLKRQVAIKFIQDVSQNNRLKDEFLALMRMRSKHVVQLYDVIQAGDNRFGLVQEFVEGDDLLASPSPTTPEDYLKIIWQIASGIADIHAAEIIHRDIKPNNMKFSAEGVLKIFDFGLARSTGLDAKTSGFKGTKGFAAPELYDSGICTFTQAVDTYAFGATALYLAVGPTIRNLTPNHFDGLSIVFEDLKPILKACFSTDPLARPLMPTVRDALARHLLVNKHQAIAVIRGTPYFLNAKNPSIIINLGNGHGIQIDYNSLNFIVSNAQGAVCINNNRASNGQEMPGSCVITLGVSGADRAFVTFDVSNPEVVL